MLTAPDAKLKYVPLCGTYLPDFPIVHIGVSIPYARKFLAFPNCSFNMLLPMLIGPAGAKFLRQLRTLQRPIIAWTVNDKPLMAWAIKKKLDGVISDDPKTYLELCDRWDEEGKKQNTGIKTILIVVWIQLFVCFLGPWFLRKKSKKAKMASKRTISVE